MYLGYQIVKIKIQKYIIFQENGKYDDGNKMDS